MSTPEQRFLARLPKIERILRAIQHRYAMTPDEAEEFAAWAKLKLIENDYRRLEAFAGRSKLSTFLRTVLTNLFRDYRIEKWGKYRVSKAAQRLGPAAILLDRLIRRDRLSEREAIAIALSRPDLDEDEAELERLVRALPARTERHVEAEPEEFFERTPGTERTGKLAEDRARSQRLRPVRQALASAIDTLEPEDRLILRLRFSEGVKIVEIARLVGLEAKPLYRRVTQILARARDGMVEAGIDPDEVRELLHEPLAELESSLPYPITPAPSADGDRRSSPSNRTNGPPRVDRS